MFTSNNNHWVLSSKDSKDLPKEVAKLIYKYDDSELFNRLYNPFEYIRTALYDHENIYEDEEFAKGILKTDKILEGLFNVEELDISVVNNLNGSKFDRKGKFAKMLLNTVIKVAMKEPEKY